MKEEGKKRDRRSQRDYTMSFKLSVVSQVEKGEMTYKQAQNNRDNPHCHAPSFKVSTRLAAIAQSMIVSVV